ncbi:MAG: hypothetical protein HUJ25_15400 [Crocinitomicaceae bacterium]|nr:hypothetical protein [Crocinitomicaceae bacterium]
MNSGKTILKVITVTSSAALIVGFVAFKAGAFKGGYESRSDSNDYNSLNTFPPDSIKKDTSNTQQDAEAKKDSNINDLIIPSSKSTIMFDPDEMPYIGSSKSLRIFEPNDSNLLNSKDSTSNDSLKATKSKPTHQVNPNQK